MLTECSDCGGKVSLDAIACPHCGRKKLELSDLKPKDERDDPWQVLGHLLGVPIFVVAVLFAADRCGRPYY